MQGTRTIIDWSDEVGVADAGYVRCGYLLTVPERLVDACRGNVEMLRRIGLDTRFLTTDEIAEVEPELSLEGLAGAAYEPDGGFADAQKMCLGWFAAAAGARAAASAGLPGDGDPGRERQGGRGWTPVEGFLPAGQVVLATGAWANDLLRPLGAEQPIELRRLQVLVGRSEPGGPLPSRRLLGRRLERGRPARPRPPVLRRRLCRRGSRWSGPTTAITACRPGYVYAVRRGLDERFPRLAGFQLVRGFAGPYDITPDWNPIIGPCPGSTVCTWPSAGAATGSSCHRPSARSSPPRSPAERRRSTFPSCGPSGSTEGRLLRLAYGPGARA